MHTLTYRSRIGFTVGLFALLLTQCTNVDSSLCMGRKHKKGAHKKESAAGEQPPITLGAAPAPTPAGAGAPAERQEHSHTLSAEEEARVVTQLRNAFRDGRLNKFKNNHAALEYPPLTRELLGIPSDEDPLIFHCLNTIENYPRENDQKDWLRYLLETGKVPIDERDYRGKNVYHTAIWRAPRSVLEILHTHWPEGLRTPSEQGTYPHCAWDLRTKRVCTQDEEDKAREVLAFLVENRAVTLSEEADSTPGAYPGCMSPKWAAKNASSGAAFKIVHDAWPGNVGQALTNEVKNYQNFEVFLQWISRFASSQPPLNEQQLAAAQSVLSAMQEKGILAHLWPSIWFPNILHPLIQDYQASCWPLLLEAYQKDAGKRLTHNTPNRRQVLESVISYGDHAKFLAFWNACAPKQSSTGSEQTESKKQKKAKKQKAKSKKNTQIAQPKRRPSFDLHAFCCQCLAWRKPAEDNSVQVHEEIWNTIVQAQEGAFSSFLASDSDSHYLRWTGIAITVSSLPVVQFFADKLSSQTANHAPLLLSLWAKRSLYRLQTNTQEDVVREDAATLEYLVNTCQLREQMAGFDPSLRQFLRDIIEENATVQQIGLLKQYLPELLKEEEGAGEDVTQEEEEEEEEVKREEEEEDVAQEEEEVKREEEEEDVAQEEEEVKREEEEEDVAQEEEEVKREEEEDDTLFDDWAPSVSHGPAPGGHPLSIEDMFIVHQRKLAAEEEGQWQPCQRSARPAAPRTRPATVHHVEDQDFWGHTFKTHGAHAQRVLKDRARYCPFIGIQGYFLSNDMEVAAWLQSYAAELSQQQVMDVPLPEDIAGQVMQLREGKFRRAQANAVRMVSNGHGGFKTAYPIRSRKFAR